MSRTGPRKADLPAVKTNYPADIFDRELTNEEMEEYIKSVERSIDFIFNNHFAEKFACTEKMWMFNLNNSDMLTVSLYMSENNPKFSLTITPKFNNNNVIIRGDCYFKNDLLEVFDIISKFYDSLIQDCRDIINRIRHIKFDTNKLNHEDKKIDVYVDKDIGEVLRKISNIDIESANNVPRGPPRPIITFGDCIKIILNTGGWVIECYVRDSQPYNGIFTIHERHVYNWRDNPINPVIYLVNIINKFLERCRATCAELIEHFEKQKSNIFRQE